MNSELPPKKSLFLAVEFLLLFILLPFLFFLDLVPVPKIAGLLVATMYCLLVLYRDSGWSVHQLKKWPAGILTWKSLAIRSVLALAMIVSITGYFYSQSLFIFPLQQPNIWALVIFLYPLFSALPQEFIYRVFLFQRYKTLFGSVTIRIVVSSISFSFLHIIYDNLLAVGLSFIAGILLSITYSNSRSFIQTSIEHTVYGWLIFTIGLGSFFYEPF